MNYTRLFDPDNRVRSQDPKAGGVADDSSVNYVYSDPAILAVNLALATRRPLLVSGPSGSGKTSLAKDVANVLDWEYLPETIHSRMQHRDLLYEIDYVLRFQDAQDKGVRSLREYVKPGILWRAFDKDSADSSTAKPATEPSEAAKKGGKPEPKKGAVVLLDEIDKAEPDLPNNLLQPLGSYRFKINELGYDVCAQRRVLMIITTNNERRLPDAFLRRCVDLVLDAPSPEGLIKIGERHYGDQVRGNLSWPANPPLLKAVADLVAGASGAQKISTAEYLDTVLAVLEAGIQYDSDTWKDLPNYTVRKSGRAGAL